MKKTVILTVLMIMMMLVFASCSGNTEPEKEPDTNDITVTSEEELASILADENVSNYDKNAAKHSMAQMYIAKANGYREKIKDEYRKRSEKYPDLYRDELFPLEENLKNVDEYFDYLENEFESNVAFFESYAVAKYHTGTAGSSLLADEEYKAAERFYLKAAEIYNKLLEPDTLGDFKNPQLLESGNN